MYYSLPKPFPTPVDIFPKLMFHIRPYQLRTLSLIIDRNIRRWTTTSKIACNTYEAAFYVLSIAQHVEWNRLGIRTIFPICVIYSAASPFPFRQTNSNIERLYRRNNDILLVTISWTVFSLSIFGKQILSIRSLVHLPYTPPRSGGQLHCHILSLSQKFR